MIQAAAAAHNIDGATLAASLAARGWDFSPLDFADPEAVAFVSTVIASQAAGIATRNAKVAAHRAAELAAREARLTPDARANPDHVCGKCDGTGKVWATWVANGVCFQCAGAGVIKRRACA
ncbi:MAG: hypothetical protein ACEQSH_00045 [Bacteroidia bacterium]